MIEVPESIKPTKELLGYSSEAYDVICGKGDSAFREIFFNVTLTK